MKRTLGILTVLCLLLCAAPLASAAGDQVALSAPADRAEEYVVTQSMAASGGEVYLLTGGGLYRWPGEGDAEWLFGTQGGSELLISSDDGTVYAYRQATGELGRVGDAGVSWDVALSAGFMQTSEDGETVYRWVEDAAVLSGRLYAVVSGDFTNDYRAQLAAFDVSTGKGELLQTGDEQLEGLVPYRAGELLLLLRGEDGSLNAVAYDPAARALGETFATFEEGYAAGVVYSEAQDACYYVQSATVLRLPRDGQPEIAAYLPETYVGDGLLLADGRYAARLSQSLYVSSLDPADLPERVLVVQGGVDGEVARAFHERYPDVPVVPAEVYFESAAGIAQAITGGEQGIDVFTLDMEGGVRELIDKDYALDLSASEAISRFTQSLYPALADAVRTKDGAPAAVYSYVSAENLLAVDTALWARYDLGEYPKTFGELLDLIVRWERDFAQDNPDVALYNYYGAPAQLARLALESFILQYSREGEAVDFTNPALRDALEKIAALPQSGDDWESLSEGEREEQNRLNSRASIVSLCGDPFAEGKTTWQSADGGRTHLLPMPPFEEGRPGSAALYGMVLFANPQSKNADLAIAYLECALTALGPESARLISPANDEPVLVEDFEAIVRDMRSGLEEARALREAAHEADKPDYDALIDYYDAWLQNTEENRWRVSAEAIARWREIAPQGVLISSAPLLTYDGGAEQVYTLLDRYLAGQLDLDAFLSELTQKARMIQLEGA